jgi:GAF domain-containing protein
MVAPIAVHGRPLGVLCLSTISEDTTYSDRDLRELQLFASNLGVYLKLLERRGETP